MKPNSQTESRELYRDPEHGFVLLTYTENKDFYRPPHDHGEAWVVYAVLSGEMQMSTYDLKDGHLVLRESYTVKAGESHVYLPGDIHDTKCLSDSARILRLTSRDLKIEKEAGRMRQYPPPGVDVCSR